MLSFALLGDFLPPSTPSFPRRVGAVVDFSLLLGPAWTAGAGSGSGSGTVAISVPSSSSVSDAVVSPSAALPLPIGGFSGGLDALPPNLPSFFGSGEMTGVDVDGADKDVDLCTPDGPSRSSSSVVASES